MSYSATNFVVQEPEEKNFIVLPKGDYPFAILEVNTMERSKAGNDMVPVKLEFRDADGNAVQVTEYLVFSQNARWKIDQFLKCVGPIEIGRAVNFEDAAFISWLKKRTGTATLTIEEVHGKNSTYDKNKVETYLASTTKREAAPAPKPAPFVPDEDEEIPF